MGFRPLRFQRISDVFVVSNRVFQNQHLLPTDPLSVSRMLGVMNRLLVNYDIDLFAYSFLPNGFWMILSDRRGHRSDFMRDFQAWVAKRANRIHEREGRFFHERFEDEAVLDAQMLVDTFVDVHAAPVREGFTRDLGDYGATSWGLLTNGEAAIGAWIDRDKLRSLRRTNPDLSEEAVAKMDPVELASPGMEGLEAPDDEDDIAGWLIEKIHKRVDRIIAWQAEMGPEKVVELRATPHPAPWNATKLEPVGPPRYRYGYTCRTYSTQRTRHYEGVRDRKRKAYSVAMQLWREASETVGARAGVGGVDGMTASELARRFPAGTFPPGWPMMRKPLDRHPNAPPRPHPRSA